MKISFFKSSNSTISPKTTTAPASSSSSTATKSNTNQRPKRLIYRRRPVNNQLLRCHPLYIMTLCIVSVSGLLVFFLLTNQSHFIRGEDYLYNTDGEDVWPINDYIKPVQKASESDADYQLRSLEPTFLTPEYKNPRLVEFYAPWCGHCRHYKPHYIHLGKESKEISEDLDFFAISCVANSKLCKRYGIHGYPTLIYFAAESDTPINVKRGPNLSATKLQNDYYLKYSHLDNQRDSSKQIEVPKSASTSEVTKSTSTLGVQSTGKVPLAKQNDIYADAASSFSFALRSSIFMSNNALSSKQQEVFQKWLTLLSKTIPRKNDVMKESLHQIDLLQSNMDAFVKSQDNLLQFLVKAEDDEKWTESCKAGYTCGLWQLLHIVTIGLVHYNESIENKSLPESNMNTVMSTMDSADNIRDYIEFYFTCDECRKNFVQMYESCQFNRCNRLSYESGSKNEWKQLALWLWEAHNDVNVRLLHESKGEMDQVSPSDEELVKWPSKSDCPYCWQDGGGWDEEVIYKYLEEFYWPNLMHLTNQAVPLNEDKVQNYAYIITIGSVIVLFGIAKLRQRQKRYRGLKK